MKNYLLVAVSLFLTPLCHAQTTETEYADILVKAYYSNANPDFDYFYGSTPGKYPVTLEPNVILGNNIDYFLSLPTQSYVIVQFTDNRIIDFPGQDDIFITESGCSGETAEVYVSTDGIDFVKLGIVDDCKTSSLDLGKINFKSAVRFVKVVGLDNKGASPGYDLVSVKGLPNSSISDYVDMEDYLLTPEAFADKKIILDKVFFDFNKAELNEESKEPLDLLYQKLSQNKQIKIKLTGHTDNIGDDNLNLNLSAKRAKSVGDFLIGKGIKKDRVSFAGKGKTEPLRSNETEEGRKTNRRVELEILQ